MERWKWISLYHQVSDRGRVRSTTKGGCAFGAHRALPREVKTRRTPYGYVEVCIHGTTLLVHRLVCRAFNGAAPTSRHEVAHGNGVRDDNRADNLRWATREENQADRVKHGTSNRGAAQWNARLTEADVRVIRAAPPAMSNVELARRFGVHRRTVADARNGRTWAHIEGGTDAAPA